MIVSLFQCANDNLFKNNEYSEIDYVVISLPGCCDIILPDIWHLNDLLVMNVESDELVLQSYFTNFR